MQAIINNIEGIEAKSEETRAERTAESETVQQITRKGEAEQTATEGGVVEATERLDLNGAA